MPQFPHFLNYLLLLCFSDSITSSPIPTVPTGSEGIDHSWDYNQGTVIEIGSLIHSYHLTAALLNLFSCLFPFRVNKYPFISLRKYWPWVRNSLNFLSPMSPSPPLYFLFPVSLSSLYWLFTTESIVKIVHIYPIFWKKHPCVCVLSSCHLSLFPFPGRFLKACISVFFIHSAGF